jgi:4-amino-4-deoxy-L-arabinose transferase-like glycosyltransferase
MKVFLYRLPIIYKVLALVFILIYLPLWVWTVHMHGVQVASGDTPLPIFSSDGEGYAVFAENLFSFGRFAKSESAPPELFRTPGYPLFLTVTGVFLGSYFFSTLLQIILTLFSGLLLYKIVEKFHSRKWALACSLLFVLEPTVVLHSLLLLSEIVHVFLLILSVYIIVCVEKRYSFLLSGLILGASALVRPISLFLPPLFLLWFLNTYWKQWRILWKQALLFIFGCMLMIIPWMVRNYFESGFFTFSTVASVNMFYYHVPQFLSWKTGQDVVSIGNDLAKQYAIDTVTLDSPSNTAKFNTLVFDVIETYPFSYPYFYAVKSSSFFLTSGLKHIDYFYNDVVYHKSISFPNFSNLLIQKDIAGLWKALWSELIFSVERVVWFVLFTSMILVFWSKKQRGFAAFCVLIVLYFAFATGPVAYSRLRIPAEPFLFMTLPFSFQVLSSYVTAKRKNSL